MQKYVGTASICMHDERLKVYNFQEVLRDKNKVQKLVQLFDPLVRAIDGIAGERVSMRVRYYILKKLVNLLFKFWNMCLPV